VSGCLSLCLLTDPWTRDASTRHAQRPTSHRHTRFGSRPPRHIIACILGANLRICGTAEAAGFGGHVPTATLAQHCCGALCVRRVERMESTPGRALQNIHGKMPGTSVNRWEDRTHLWQRNAREYVYFVPRWSRDCSMRDILSLLDCYFGLWNCDCRNCDPWLSVACRTAVRCCG